MEMTSSHNQVPGKQNRRIALSSLSHSLELFQNVCILHSLPCFGRGMKCSTREGEESQKSQKFHFPSCSSIGKKDKPGTTVRREKTRSHYDLDMWNRLAPYVLRLFGRHGQSPGKKKERQSKRSDDLQHTRISKTLTEKKNERRQLVPVIKE